MKNPDRIFLDTEFFHSGRTTRLISIGIAGPDGREYYGVALDRRVIDRGLRHEFIRDNVIPHLPIRQWRDSEGVLRWDWDYTHKDAAAIKTNAQIAKDVRKFILSYKDPQLWSWFSAFDNVVYAELYGQLGNMPDGLPWRVNDIEQYREYMGNPPLPMPPKNAHNALADAYYHKKIWESVYRYDQGLDLSVRAVKCEPLPGGGTICFREGNE